MNDEKYISSLQNPVIKKIVRLKEKKRGRDLSGEFILEGRRELEMALKGGYELRSLFFYAAIISRDEVETLSGGNVVVIELSQEVYQRIAYREKTEGILALSVSKSHDLNRLKISKENSLILIAESPEKPGNIGALLRTADAAGLDAVIIADPKGDLYNPNVIRSSVGCLFTVAVGLGTTAAVLQFLQERKISLITASLQATTLYTEIDFNRSCAIAVGTESTGLTDIWSRQAEMQVIIPMQGEIDSMNVSVSAAILIFEAKRQRGFRFHNTPHK